MSALGKRIHRQLSSVPVWVLVIVVAILQFLWSWNEFLIARTMTSGGDPVNLPATVGLADLVGEISSAGPVAAAATFVHAAVPLMVFFGLQRHIVSGLLTGSVNG